MVVEFIDVDSEKKEIIEADLTDFFGLTNKKSLSGKVKEGKHNIKILPTESPIKEIIIHEKEINENINQFIKIDDAPEFENFVEVYAINPGSFNFTNATVTANAKGNALMKCKDWNFTSQICFGEWEKIMDLTPGQDYTFTLTPEDHPGYGEINITVAQHLDENYTFIADIYDEVKAQDNNWSEPIYANEFVRVTYEKNLSNGNVIDVFVRNSNLINTWFEIYNINTTSPTLGSSEMIDSADGKWIYITLKNVAEPVDTFDIKILGEEFLEFDYIHDAVTGAILPSSLSNDDADTGMVPSAVDELAPGESTYVTKHVDYDITGKSSVAADPAWIQVGYSRYFSPNSFDTAIFGSDTPFGITTVNGTEFWITDYQDDEVYYVTSAGVLIDSFDTAGFGSDFPTSITTVNGTEFWITDAVDDEVYHVTSSGVLISQFDIAGFGSDNAFGITTVNGTEFWISDHTDAEIYRITSSGVLISQFDTAGFGSTYPVGITKDGTEFWIVDTLDAEVYHTNSSGTLIDQFDTAIFGSNFPAGITKYGTEFWITDYAADEVYHVTPIILSGATINSMTFYWGHKDNTNWRLTTADPYTGIVWSPNGTSTFYNVTDYTVSTTDKDESYTLTTGLPTATQLNNGIYVRFIGYDLGGGAEDDLLLDYSYFTVDYIKPPTVNTPPENPITKINSTDGSNKTKQNLNCFSTISDPNPGDKLNVTIQWFKNNSLNLTIDYNNSFSSGTFFSTILNSANTTKGDSWKCGMKLFDGEFFSNFTNSSELTILNTPPVVNLVFPADGNITTNRTPTFFWNATDDDNDGLTYELNISCYPGCSSDNRFIQVLINTNHTLQNKLQFLSDNNFYYNWTVRANDGEIFGSFAKERRIFIQALLTISLINDSVNFGQLANNESKNTTLGNPGPLVIQNDGNSFLNISVNVTSLFDSALSPTNNYQLKIGNSTEHGAFEWLNSLTNWFNAPIITTMAIVNLNPSDEKDTSRIDLRVRVPEDETAGNKSSTIIFTSTLAE
ncbi:hypothetical protein HYT23_03960 [Candidatus Pacearchaeota archaeon]|nr:hypothetical protein [Candidatus Pacearchaeota archaeon]